MFKILVSTFKLKILQCWGLFMIEAALRLAASLMIQEIISAAMITNVNKAYESAAILLILIMFSAIFKHNAFY
jgi:hypothetical protein